MKIVVIAETHVGEHRVALVPEIAAKLVASGFEVFVEEDAGEEAGFTDDAYREAGVIVEADRKKLLGIADVVLSVQPPRVEDVAMIEPDRPPSVCSRRPVRLASWRRLQSMASPRSQWYSCPAPAVRKAWMRCLHSLRLLAIKQC